MQWSTNDYQISATSVGWLDIWQPSVETDCKNEKSVNGGVGSWLILTILIMLHKRVGGEEGTLVLVARR